MLELAIINGPNLNLLGTSEPEVYGHASFEECLEQLKKDFPTVHFTYFQSNIEGEIVEAIQSNGFNKAGIILNPAAYTHTSIAIGDAIKGIETPVIEVHISNVYAREEFRHLSYIAPNAKGVIAGFGLQSYELALESFI